MLCYVHTIVCTKDRGCDLEDTQDGVLCAYSADQRRGLTRPRANIHTVDLAVRVDSRASAILVHTSYDLRILYAMQNLVLNNHGNKTRDSGEE